MSKLDGQIAFITGGSSGIGRATAIAFAREGAGISVFYHSNDDGAEATQAAVEAKAARASW